MEVRPIELRTRIRLAARCDVGMAGDVLDGMLLPQEADEPGQGRILRRSERDFVAAFEFDADREVVAASGAAPARFAGVPGAQAARHELHEPAVAPDQEVGGDAQRLDFPVVGMRVGIQGVGEQALDAVAAELARGQGNGVHHDQPHGLPGGTLIAIGGRDAPNAGQPAFCVEPASHSAQAAPCGSAGSGR